MSAVWSCNEWDPLEEVIVGNPLRARYPTADKSTQVAEFQNLPLDQIPRGPFPQWVVEETEEETAVDAETDNAEADDTEDMQPETEIADAEEAAE